MCSYIFWLQERKTAWWEVEGWGSKRGAGIGQARDSKAWSSGQGDRVGSRYQRPKCRLDVSAERKDMCAGPLTGSEDTERLQAGGS